MQSDLGDIMLILRIFGDGKKLPSSTTGLAVPRKLVRLNCPRPPRVEVNLGLADDLLNARELLLGFERVAMGSTTHLALHGENIKGVEWGSTCGEHKC